MRNDIEYIACSAIWYKDLPLKVPEVLETRGFRPFNVDRGIVFGGLRHHNCMYQMVALTGFSSHEVGESIQGFITSKNRFVDRREGAQIAYEAGQTDEIKKKLYSEDIY